MDKPFLAELQSWFAALASGLAGCNRALSIRESERAARQLVELLVFLAICQRRGILPAGTLETLAGRSGVDCPLYEWLEPVERRIGSALFEVQQASGAGRPRKHRLPGVPIDNAVLGHVVARLVAQDVVAKVTSRSAEILGRVHAHLLGLRLCRCDGGYARMRYPTIAMDGAFKVHRCSAAKKENGVFYTPDYITRYIVRNSVGRQLDVQPAKIAGKPDLRIVDPACGCGAFLVAACRYLRQWCQRNDLPGRAGTLANQIHGVDIDPEAVLVARRSLWLEMTQAEAEPVSRRRVGQRGEDGSLLADLAQNVRWGDVLADSVAKDKAGQFDIVLGNPPYRRELNAKQLLDRIAATDFGRRWRTARMDLWYYFLHRGLELLKPGGRLCFIVGSYWSSSSGSAELVRALCQSAHIEEIFSLGSLRVFPEVAGRHMILSVTKGASSKSTKIKTAAAGNRQDAEPFVSGRLPVTVFEKTAEQLFRRGRIDLEPPADHLLAKIVRGVPLGTLGKVRQGIAENPAAVTRRTNQQHGNRWKLGEGVFALSPDELARLKLPEREMQLIRPYHDLCDLGRYFLADQASLLLIYSTRETCADIDQYPVLRAHLARFRSIMQSRRETRQGARRWWQLHWPREESLWLSAKIISVQMAPRPAFVPASVPVYVPFSTNVFVPLATTREHLNYITAILNSRLIWKWYAHHAKRRGVGLEINGHVLARTPIRTIDFSDPSDRSRHNRLVELVDRLLLLHRRQAEKAAKPNDAAAIDRRIDELVYELYGLADDEISLVDMETSNAC